MFEKIGRITAQEQLFLDRRRKQESQAQAAKRFGVSRSLYGRWERGESNNTPQVTFDSITTSECCILHRRRSNFTQSEVAKHLHCCRWMIVRMEHGKASCHQLLQWWESGAVTGA